MRKFLIRWWYTPTWVEEQRKRKVGDWFVEEPIQGTVLINALKQAISEFCVYPDTVYFDETGIHQVK